jgi:hypothetical protein
MNGVYHIDNGFSVFYKGSLFATGLSAPCMRAVLIAGPTLRAKKTVIVRSCESAT